jgi:hypothetical protein
MGNKKQPNKTYPVCQEHWNRMRDEALVGLSAWSKLIARFRVNQVLQQKGFIRSDSECRFCQTKSKD